MGKQDFFHYQLMALETAVHFRRIWLHVVARFPVFIRQVWNASADQKSVTTKKLSCKNRAIQRAKNGHQIHISTSFCQKNWISWFPAGYLVRKRIFVKLSENFKVKLPTARTCREAGADSAEDHQSTMSVDVQPSPFAGRSSCRRPQTQSTDHSWQWLLLNIGANVDLKIFEKNPLKINYRKIVENFFG